MSVILLLCVSDHVASINKWVLKIIPDIPKILIKKASHLSEAQEERFTGRECFDGDIENREEKVVQTNTDKGNSLDKR